ncbi:hypothetical protein [Maricaulis salignorans]|uniref:hypothetical protein n=1 Tax=Maricaulis salignorans TaxID=144026 RepID=UPI003A8F94EC
MEFPSESQHHPFVHYSGCAMRPVELAEKVYQFELSLRSEISSSLSLPVAGLAFLSAASGVLLSNFSFAFDSPGATLMEIAGSLVFAVAMLILLASVVFAFWSIASTFLGNGYESLRPAENFEQLWNDAREGGAEEEFIEGLNEQLLTNYTNFARNNNRLNKERDHRRQRIVLALKIGIVAFSVGYIVFLIEAAI